MKGEKEKLREKLEKHIKLFTRSGGKITTIPAGLSKDPKSFNGEPQRFNHDSIFDEK